MVVSSSRPIRDRALFDLAIDSKLRGCDLVEIRIRDVIAGPEIRTRAVVIQQKMMSHQRNVDVAGFADRLASVHISSTEKKRSRFRIWRAIA